MSKEMKHTTLILITLLIVPCVAMAQRFDHERFDADRAQYITLEAGLSAADSTVFFQLFYEMQEKKREVHCQLKACPKEHPATEEECRQEILGRDSLELQMKTIEQAYHEKMLQALKPSLVCRALKAEADFCRQAFRRVAKKMKE